MISFSNEMPFVNGGNVDLRQNDKSLQDVIDDGGEIYRCPTVLAMSGYIRYMYIHVY